MNNSFCDAEILMCPLWNTDVRKSTADLDRKKQNFQTNEMWNKLIKITLISNYYLAQDHI